MSQSTNTEEHVRRALDATASEHYVLLKELRRLEELVEGGIYARPSEVAKRLRELAQSLAAHQVEEESSTLYAWLPQAFPELKGEIDRLKGEHTPLLSAARELSKAAAKARSIGLTTDVGVRIRTFIAALRQHEAGESTVLQRALRLARSASVSGASPAP